MYFPYFIAYMTIGLVLSAAVFLWALRSGQFRDQQRARYLPLADPDGALPLKNSPLRRIEIYALGLLAVGGLAATGAVLLFALYYNSRIGG